MWQAVLCRKCKIANKSSFGAFVEILPGVKGMVHISEMDTGRSNLEDFPDGTEIDVKLLEVRQQTLSGLLCRRRCGRMPGCRFWAELWRRCGFSVFVYEHCKTRNRSQTYLCQLVIVHLPSTQLNACDAACTRCSLIVALVMT